MTKLVRPRQLLSVIGVVVAVSALVIAAGKVFPSLNPFGTETRDRSQPTLLRSLHRLSEYRAARANLQQIIDVERDAKLLPGFIKGERTLAVASGTVDAFVDFGRLDRRALRVSDDGRSVTVTLPPARLAPSRVDLERTRVVKRDRGLLDRVGDMLGKGGADDERQLLLLAQRKLDIAARTQPGLLLMAQRNTTRMLRRLVLALGFERVRVRFAPQASGTSPRTSRKATDKVVRSYVPPATMSSRTPS